MNDNDKLNRIKNELPKCCQDYLNSPKIKETAIHTQLQYGYKLRSYYRYIKDQHPSDGEDINHRIIHATSSDINDYIKSTGKKKDGSKDDLSNTSLRFNIFALSGLYSYFVSLALIEDNPVKSITYKENIKKLSPAERSTPVSADDINSIETTILQATNLSKSQKIYNKKTKFRNVLIIHIIKDTHATAQMISDLNLSDVDIKNNTLTMTFYDNHKEVIPISPVTTKEISAYINSQYTGGRQSFKPEDDEEALFLSRKHKRMAARSIQYMIKEYAQLTFDDVKAITPTSIATFS